MKNSTNFKARPGSPENLEPDFFKIFFIFHKKLFTNNNLCAILVLS